MARKSILVVSFLWLFSIQYVLWGQIKTEKIANGTVYQITQTDESYSLDSARYTLFIPDGIEQLRGVFVHQHGCTMEGRGASTAYDLQYQAFAKKWGLAVVGPDLYSASGNCHQWKNPEAGSGPAFINSLKEVAVYSGHAELEDIPWLLWGHSGGGYWVQAMLRDYPDRVIALFGYSPGLNPQWDYPKSVNKVPVMIRHAGEVGDACCWMSALNTYDKLKEIDGKVSIAYTPYQNHNYSYVRYMAIPFFEAVMSQRLSEKDPFALQDMNPSQAWLGDPSAINTYKASAYKGDPSALCWLPDSMTAAKWKEYVITGTVIDRTPPSAPYDLQLEVKHNRMVELTWRADADIESGIQYFNIYKGNNIIARFPSVGDYQRFDLNGDDTFPVTTLPGMKMELTGIIVDDNKISISTVNHFSLESARREFPQ